MQARKNVEVSCRILVGLALLVKSAICSERFSSSDLKPCMVGECSQEKHKLGDKIAEASQRDEVEVRDYPIHAMTTTGDYTEVDGQVDLSGSCKEAQSPQIRT